MKRREARNEAYLIIFEMGFQKEPIADMLKCAVEGREAKLNDYAKALSEQTHAHLEEIDEKISQNLENWKLERIPKTTLAVLRLAICELDWFPDIPVKVTINEAVELAKTYSTQEDAAYINGVLGAYIKIADPQKNPEAPLE